jgi:hypothetical protein
VIIVQKNIKAVFSPGHDNNLMMDFLIEESFPTFPLFRVGKYPTLDNWRLETFKLTEKQKDLINQVASLRGIIQVMGSFHGEITVEISPVFGWKSIFQELRKIFEEFDYGHLEHHEAEDWPEPESILIVDKWEGTTFHIAKPIGKTDHSEYDRSHWEDWKRRCDPEQLPGKEFVEKIFKIFSQKESDPVIVYSYRLFIGKKRDIDKFPEEKIQRIKEMLEEFLQAK